MEILIIEDDKELRALYSDFFSHEFTSTNCEFSNDGIEGYFKTSLTKFDLIILDHEMPRFKGLDLLVALKNKPGLNQTTPVIFISGYLHDELKKTDLFENVHFISKPFDFHSLTTIINNFSEKQST